MGKGGVNMNPLSQEFRDAEIGRAVKSVVCANCDANQKFIEYERIISEKDGAIERLTREMNRREMEHLRTRGEP
jgi:hypothetical protein